MPLTPLEVARAKLVAAQNERHRIVSTPGFQSSAPSVQYYLATEAIAIARATYLKEVKKELGVDVNV